jgi:O-antigen/teichoic acid export membrane protein
MEYKKRSVIDLAVALLVGFSSIAMALAGLGVWSLVFAGMIGALATNVLLSLIVPLRPKLRWHLATVRQHASYGVKLTVNELLTYFKEQAVYLVVSKNAGAEALGLLTRGESLARMPNRFVTPPVGRVVFRAMSKVQDDLDQSKYLFYRTITLLTAYVGPLLVIFIWVAEPLVLTVYGAKWLPAAGPAQILAVAGFFLVLGRPASVLLEARNRLNQEMVVQAVTLVVAVGGSLFGLRWGLTGAAWAIVSAHIFSATCLYMLAHRTVRASARDMTRAVSPAIVLNGLLAATLGVLHFALADLRTNAPAAYLLVMAACGGLVYAMAFLFLPLEALRSEADRWKRLITSTLKRAGR